MPTWAHLPLERLLSEELSSTIKAAIQALPEKYRLVMVLRDIEGFSTVETAQILNLKPSNITSKYANKPGPGRYRPSFRNA